jgi:steroid 5-alpha reductase family enzyme
MPLPALLLIAWLLAAIAFHVAWCFQQRHHDASIVDVVWAFSFGPLALLYALLLRRDDVVSWLLVALVIAWSSRLGGHLYLTRIRGGRGEDGRYAAIRSRKGDRAGVWFFGFFQAQALSVLLLSLSSLAVLLDPPRWPQSAPQIVAGSLLFLLSIGGEALADVQLARFRADPVERAAKRVCRRGLWRYSRHPNYFFEWLHWLAYPVLAYGSSDAWLTWIAPPVMLFLILAVTGIPPTEAQALKSRGEAYRRYQRTTSAFVPWFVSKENSS